MPIDLIPTSTDHDDEVACPPTLAGREIDVRRVETLEHALSHPAPQRFARRRVSTRPPNRLDIVGLA